MIDTRTDTAPTGLLAHPPGACAPLEGGLRIPLALLTPSPLNPRKRWTTERVARMVASLRTSGQVQPIRVRPNPQYTPSNGRPPYEIVVGETRWRAAPEAGLTTLDAVVGDYTDQQVIELGVVENTDRNDLHPLEEAEAYKALLRKPDGLQGYADVADLAARFGQSPSYVYQRLKLLNLCPAGREAFLADKIKASVALLIARMPDQAEQAKATATIAAGWGGEPYSTRTAADLLQRDYMLALAKAPFDVQATYGVAGPCHQCPKRSGAAPDLFADVTGGDMCQDSRCYQAKGEEAKQARLAAERAAQAAAGPAPGAAPAPADDGAAKAPPKAATPAPAAKAPAREAAAPARKGGAGESAAERAAADAAREESLTREKFGQMLFGELADAAGREPENLAAMRLAACRAFNDMSYEAATMLYTTHGWPPVEVGRQGGYDVDFGRRVAKANEATLRALLAETLVAEDLSGALALEHLTGYHIDTGKLLAAYGMDAPKWWKLARMAARTELAQQAVAKEQPAKNKPAAGAARRALTPTDAFIEQHGPGATAAPKPAAKKTAKPAVKYRCPQTGSTWSGRGLQPAWLKVALADGKKLADFETAGKTSQMDEGTARDHA